MDTTENTAAALDRAGTATLFAVHEAMLILGGTVQDAVALVAKITRQSTETVDGLLTRGALVAAGGAL